LKEREIEWTQLLKQLNNEHVSTVDQCTALKANAEHLSQLSKNQPLSPQSLQDSLYLDCLTEQERQDLEHWSQQTSKDFTSLLNEFGQGLSFNVILVTSPIDP
jgi:SMC interacting uncharacterized protein involved in chromosome segregation